MRDSFLSVTEEAYYPPRSSFKLFQQYHHGRWRTGPLYGNGGGRLKDRGSAERSVHWRRVRSVPESDHYQVDWWTFGCLRQQNQAVGWIGWVQGRWVREAHETDFGHRVPWHCLNRTSTGVKHWSPDHGGSDIKSESADDSWGTKPGCSYSHALTRQ